MGLEREINLLKRTDYRDEPVMNQNVRHINYNFELNGKITLPAPFKNDFIIWCSDHVNLRSAIFSGMYILAPE